MLAFLATAVLAPVQATAAPITFDFKDPKGVNTVQWLVDSDVEPISGSATNVTGSVQFHPNRPEQTRGKLIIASESMRAPVALMTEHLHSPNWLDAKRYPTIEFNIRSIGRVVRDRSANGAYRGTVTGDLTMHGVTQPVQAPVVATYLPNGIEARTGGRQKGATLRVRTRFTIKRSAFKIGPTIPTVGEDIEITAFVTGVAPQ
jgi:polyisoprenoid-binding protein YceI